MAPRNFFRTLLFATVVFAAAVEQRADAEMPPAFPFVAWGRGNFSMAQLPAEFTNALSLSISGAGALAVNRDGSLAGWRSEAREIPPNLTNVAAAAVTDFVRLALLSDGRVIGWGSDWGSNVPPAVTNAVQIAAGWELALALRSDGTVVQWNNPNGLTQPAPADLRNVVGIAATYANGYALLANGTVRGWGADTNFGLLAIPPGLSNVVEISAGLDPY
jgi:uncharacterized membrane protein